MEDAEELRETIMTMRRELDLLRIETTHANLLLAALDTVLGVNGDFDPFAGVFSALMPVFSCSCVIVLIEQDTGQAALQCVSSSHHEAVGSTWPIGRLFEKVLSGRIISTVANPEIGNWPHVLAEELSAEQPALYLPLAVRGHRGLMLLLRDRHRPGFDRTHVALARKFSLLASHAFAARQASLTAAESHRLKDLTEQLKSSQEALRFRANHDQLTGLPNRAYFQELVSEMIARKQPGQKLALAFFDLDKFKQVNDLHGHATGDALLREVATRVRSEIRDTDVFGRISGDEFVLAIDPVKHRLDASSIIDRVRTRLRQPLNVQGAEIRPSASVGIALYPAHGSDYETLRRHADLAMYRAKTDSRGSVAHFTHGLGQQARQRLTSEQRLREAVSEGEFRCALQQKVDIRTGDVVGFEALTRWVDARGKIQLPGEFMPLAGQLDLVDDITMLVVGDLMRKLPELDAMFGPMVRYSINICPAQTINIPFMLNLTQRLATGQTGRFIFELTEESLAATGPLETHILPMLQTVGIRLSIDDFGAGYSSLAKLATLPVDELKIDRSLIESIHNRPRNQIILRAIESLGSALTMSIVAEGIESADECAFLLQNTKISIGQGFLLHRPQLLSDLLGQKPSSKSRSLG